MRQSALRLGLVTGRGREPLTERCLQLTSCTLQARVCRGGAPPGGRARRVPLGPAGRAGKDQQVPRGGRRQADAVAAAAAGRRFGCRCVRSRGDSVHLMHMPECLRSSCIARVLQAAVGREEGVLSPCNVSPAGLLDSIPKERAKLDQHAGQGEGADCARVAEALHSSLLMYAQRGDCALESLGILALYGNSAWAAQGPQL
jgi:hypothetical protein